MANSTTHGDGALSGKAALVTGASRNMGRAIALELGRLGANVALNTRHSADELTAAVQEVRSLGVKATGLLGDASEQSVMTRLVREAEDQLGGIDIFVNTPAVRPVQPFLEISLDDWRGVMKTNIESFLHGAQATVPHMLKNRWGRLIAFSGAAAFHGAPKRTHVMASKAAIAGMVRALALEFAAEGITVNTICPGPFETERAASWQLGNGLELPGSATRPPGNLPPVGRLGNVSEVAALCAHLCSDSGGFITGQALHINGGSYLA